MATRALILSAFVLLCAMVIAVPSAKSRVSASAPIPGPLNLARLTTTGLDFSVPPSGIHPKIDQRQVEVIAQQSPEFVRASEVRYRFLLFSTPVTGVSAATIQSDPTLASSFRTLGHPQDVPVWVVSFEGLLLPASVGSAVNHEDNEVLDAYSGLPILSFTYR